MIDLSKISRNLEQTAEGIWRCRSVAQVSYPEWGNQACFEVEDHSFWFRHRNACLREAMKRYPPSGPVFDVGGGNGAVAKAMQDAGLGVVLVEPGAAGAANARLRGIQHVVCATLDEAGFLPESLPAIGLFDVVEHIEDDGRFLATMRNYLSTQGRVYLTVPSYPALWSLEDTIAGHCRRYSKIGLHDGLTKAGFEVEFVTGIFQFLLPAILAVRAVPYRLGFRRRPEPPDAVEEMKRQHEIRNAWISGTLGWLQQREISRIRNGRASRVGASWLAVARKAPQERSE